MDLSIWEQFGLGLVIGVLILSGYFKGYNDGKAQVYRKMIDDLSKPMNTKG